MSRYLPRGDTLHVAPRQAGFLCLLLAMAACALTSATAHATEPLTRISDDADMPEKWREEGFRLQTRFGFTMIEALNPSPRGQGLALSFEPGWSFGGLWSWSLAAHYRFYMGTPFNGLHWALTTGPTITPVRGLGIGLAGGFSGMLTQWADSDNITKVSPPTGRCDGVGALGTLHAQYLFPVSDNFSMGPQAAVDAVFTRCREVENVGLNNNAYKGPWLNPWWQLAVRAMWTLAWR